MQVEEGEEKAGSVMAMLKVVRPVEVTEYQCDAHEINNCESTCADGGNFPRDCDWIRFDDWRGLKAKLRKNPQFHGTIHDSERIWFCGYSCLSDWAQAQALESGEITGTMATVAA